MEKKEKKLSVTLALIGGVIAWSTLLAGFLPYFYRRGIVYFGIGWIKIVIFAIGLVIAGYGLFTYFKKPEKK